MKTDPALRKKVLANVEDIYKFHKQPPTFKMPGVKEYGTKIYGSVTILNAEGDVENHYLMNRDLILSDLNSTTFV